MRFSIRVEAITYYLLALTRKAVADKFLILSMTSPCGVLSLEQ